MRVAGLCVLGVLLALASSPSLAQTPSPDDGGTPPAGKFKDGHGLYGFSS